MLVRYEESDPLPDPADMFPFSLAFDLDILLHDAILFIQISKVLNTLFTVDYLKIKSAICFSQRQNRHAQKTSELPARSSFQTEPVFFVYSPANKN